MKIANISEGAIILHAQGLEPLLIKHKESHEFKSEADYIPYSKNALNLIQAGLLKIEEAKAAKAEAPKAEKAKPAEAKAEDKASK